MFIFFAHTSSKHTVQQPCNKRNTSRHALHTDMFLSFRKKYFGIFFCTITFFSIRFKATVKTRQRLVIFNPVFLTFFFLFLQLNIVKSTELLTFEAGSAKNGPKFSASWFQGWKLKRKLI